MMRRGLFWIMVLFSVCMYAEIPKKEAAGVKVLFTTWTYEGQETDWKGLTPATPVACRYHGAWVSDRHTCHSLLPGHFSLPGRGIEALRSEERDVFGQEVVLFAAAEKKPSFFTYPDKLGDALLSHCTPKPVSKALHLRQPLRVSDALLHTLDAQARAVLHDILSRKDLSVEGPVLEGDYDGDGDTDRLLTIQLPLPKHLTQEAGLGVYLAILDWQGGTGEIIGFSLYTPYFPGQSRCFDLDQDKRPEILLAEGGETERSYRYLEYNGTDMISVGFGMAGGD